MARSMMELTSRMVGPSSDVSCALSTTASSRMPASARMAAMASAAFTFSYRMLMACRTADDVAIMGTIFLRLVSLARSIAMKFKGSDIARNRLSLTT